MGCDKEVLLPSVITSEWLDGVIEVAQGYGLDNRMVVFPPSTTFESHKDIVLFAEMCVPNERTLPKNYPHFASEFIGRYKDYELFIDRRIPIC